MSLLTKIKPRPIIDEGFRQTYMRIAEIMIQDIEYRSRNNPRFFAGNPAMKITLERLQRALDLGRLPDNILTKMYALDFEKFSGFFRPKDTGAGTAKDIYWLVGTTRDITLTTGKGYQTGAKVLGSYKTGKWYIYIPHTAYLNGTLGDIHLIPAEAPTEDRMRHPHHYAVKTVSTHPLDWTPHTCVGGFGTVFASLAYEVDVPETFRLLYTFVGRANLNSILTRRPEHIPWIAKLNPQECGNAYTT